MSRRRKIQLLHSDVMLDPALTTPIAHAICRAVYRGSCQCEKKKDAPPCDAMVLAAASAATLTRAFLRQMAGAP